MEKIWRIYLIRGIGKAIGGGYSTNDVIELTKVPEVFSVFADARPKMNEIGAMLEAKGWRKFLSSRSANWCKDAYTLMDGEGAWGYSTMQVVATTAKDVRLADRESKTGEVWRCYEIDW